MSSIDIYGGCCGCDQQKTMFLLDIMILSYCSIRICSFGNRSIDKFKIILLSTMDTFK